MSRAGRAFKEVFDELGLSVNLTPAEVAANAPLQMKLLDCFQRGYRDAYRTRIWEEAWKPGELEVTDGLVTYAQVEDAKYFDFWSADPRTDRGASRVGSATSADGIHLGTGGQRVFGFWLPLEPRFTLTPYDDEETYAAGARVLAEDGHVYVSLAATEDETPEASPAAWRRVPVLNVISEISTDLAAGRHLIASGKYEAGRARREDGLTALEKEAMTEYARLARVRQQAGGGDERWAGLENWAGSVLMWAGSENAYAGWG